MKAITERTKEIRANAWGVDQVIYTQLFEIEESDVDRCRDNYYGFRRPGPVFRSSHVGQHIQVLTDDSPNWTCWSFA